VAANAAIALEKGKLPVAKLCPFKMSEGSSCPFGSNCRFSHSEWSFTQSQFAYKPAAKVDVPFSASSKYFQIIERWPSTGDSDSGVKVAPYLLSELSEKDELDQQIKRNKI
jgi:hypothetical protein